jgi:purine-binding chemotaxis protein CheW
MVATAGSRGGAGDKLVCFRLHGQEFGAEISEVKETLTPRPVTRVFLTPSWLAGIMNLRGDVVPVVDLALFLGMTAAVPSDDSRIVLTERGPLRAGLLVESLAELRTFDLDRLGPPPATLPADQARFYRGLATIDDGSIVRVLDLAGLLECERLRTLDGQRDL